MKNFVIIVAGGTGSRMASSIPKQYLLLAEKPVLMHTIDKFLDSEVSPEVLVVLHPAMYSYWLSLCEEFDYLRHHHICLGGESRFQSVENGLRYLKALNLPIDYIAVHDAARPLVAKQTINEAFELATLKKAVVVATPSTNSVRQVVPEKASKALNRNEIWLVQTPQVFATNVLYEAYQQREERYFTDDASVVEQLGYSIHILEGDYKNIKITFPEDLAIAQLYQARDN